MVVVYTSLHLEKFVEEGWLHEGRQAEDFNLIFCFKMRDSREDMNIQIFLMIKEGVNHYQLSKIYV